MGKIIRKKSASAKKKKKQGAGGPKQAQNKEPANVKAEKETETGSRPKSPVVKKSSQMSAAAGKQKSKPGVKIAFIEKSIQFLREVKVELKKVAWPSRKQTLGSTAVVLVLVFMIAFFLGIMDIILASLIKIVL